MALITFALMAPPALCAPLVGALVDRVAPQRLLVAAHLACAPCLLGLAAVRSPATLWLAFPLAAAAATLAAPIRPAVMAALPRLVADEAASAAANGLKGQLDAATNVAAPLLSSLLFLTGHAPLAFVGAALAYGAAAALGARVRLPRRPAAGRPEEVGPLGRLFVGFRFLLRENARALAALAAAEAGISLSVGAWYTLIVALCATSFGVGAGAAGVLDAAWAGGGVLGGFVVAWAPRSPRFGGRFLLGVAGSAVGTALLGLSPAGLAPFGVALLLGVADVALQVDRAVVLQAATPHEVLGRVLSAFEAVQVLAKLLGIALVGLLVASAGPRGATVAVGLLGLAGLLATLPALLGLERAIGVRIFLRQVPLLAALSRRLLDDLGGRLREEVYPAGAVIVREGERGDRLYMIQDGAVEVVAQGDGRAPLVVATLHKLEYFGEIALLRETVRTATVRARRPTRLYSLDRAAFARLVERAGPVERALSPTAAARALDTHSKTRDPTRRPGPSSRA